MSKILASIAAFALLAMLALPGPANAAERRTDGLRANEAAAPTEFSSYRRWHRRAWWGPRYGYYRPYWRPRYAAWGYPYGYGYGYYPYYYRPRPVVAFSIGFGPRWGWGGPRWWW